MGGFSIGRRHITAYTLAYKRRMQMSMYGKIGEWYDAHSEVLPDPTGLIAVDPTIENRAEAFTMIYGSVGRQAKIGAVRKPIAEVALCIDNGFEGLPTQ